jgi:hypothetical protein
MTYENALGHVHNLFNKQFVCYIKVYMPGQFEALRKIYCGSHKEII